ncbi:hypothetical protein CNQ84_16190 [Pseudomonas abyssi]|uniref:Uncharacterized protein n=1 Tax=Pseudomonas abyssi TaxID=170540 RepID=A0A2A3ME16_9PSED|nr:hypothetical protein CNQ84_16190 [Pseudomonas abyssi]
MTNPSASVQAPIHQACALGKVTEMIKSGANGQLLRDRGAARQVIGRPAICATPRQPARSSGLLKLAQ